MKTTKKRNVRKAGKVFYIGIKTKKQLAIKLGFKSVYAFEKLMIEKGLADLIHKESWYYTPKQVEEILVALDKIKKRKIIFVAA